MLPQTAPEASHRPDRAIGKHLFCRTAGCPVRFEAMTPPKAAWAETFIVARGTCQEPMALR